MYTLKSVILFEEEIKKSRFIVNASPVQTIDEAMQFLRSVEQPQASHNCWAYRMGQSYRFSDDGEPGGTAGKPILNAIEKQEIDYVMVVVTRYFGGIKLGAGGLIRAYGGSAAKCLQVAEKKEMKLKVLLKINSGFEWIGSVYNMFEKFDVEKISENYLDTGIELVARLNESEQAAFIQILTDISSGQIEIARAKKTK